MSGLAPNTQSAFGFPMDPPQALPCLNPSCKSHGKPHPNCRCYSGSESGYFSDGGEVGFCSAEREHNQDCEYYAGGGDVLPSYESVVGAENELPSYESVVGDSGDLPSYDEVVGAEDRPTDYMETAKAAAEGLAQGIAGPIAPWAQVNLGISTKEDIARRAEENPIAHGIGEAAGFVGSLATGTGLAGFVAKGAGKVARAAELGKAGSVILKGALESAAFEVSNETTKAILGQGDPERPVSAALLHVGAAGLMGGATRGVFTLGEGLIGKGINSKMGREAAEKVETFLADLAKSDDPLKALGVNKKVSDMVSKSIAFPLAMKTGTGQAGYVVIEALLAKPVSKVMGKLNPYARAALLKAASVYESAGVANAVHYASEAFKGEQKAVQGLATIFSAGTAAIAEPVSEAAREQLKEFIEGGQVEQQIENSTHAQAQGNNFASGGMVSEPNTSFSKVFPEQNMLLNAAKGRISTYLNSIRPLPNQQKLPFDRASKNKDKHREYSRAIDLAVNPLSILDRVNKGDITPSHMKHFVAMYPEVYRYLGREMTKKITEAQVKGESVPYRKRQAMSLFLGANLDSTFTPAAIQTIQGLYAKKQVAMQQQVAAKKSASLTKTANRFSTDDQARQTRQQSSKA